MRLFYDLVLLLAVAWHVAGLSGVTDGLTSSWFLVALAIVGVSFVVAIVLHPARRWSTQGETVAHLSWRDATYGVSRAKVWMAAGLVVYGLVVGVVALVLAKMRLGGEPVSTDELGPVGNTAFTLLFAAMAWLSGQSGLALEARMKAEGTWFR